MVWKGISFHPSTLPSSFYHVKTQMKLSSRSNLFIRVSQTISAAWRDSFPLSHGQGCEGSFYLQQLKWDKREQTSSWKIEHLLEKRKSCFLNFKLHVCPSGINWVVVLPVVLGFSLPPQHDFPWHNFSTHVH